jgi:superfamily II DNA or RNA helicase/HKD family nuclease
MNPRRDAVKYFAIQSTPAAPACCDERNLSREIAGVRFRAVTEELGPGLYESLITAGLTARLGRLPAHLSSEQRELRSAEAADRIAWHLSRQIERALEGVADEERLEVGLKVARELLGRLADLAPADRSALPVDPARVLHAVIRRRPDGGAGSLAEPLIPLLDTTLLTNAPGEPSLWNQLRSEIESADAIDVVMAFIRRSGIAPLLDPLRRHVDDGRPLRILTTTYTGSTERRALDELMGLGARVRISYDLSTTRLHAKAWVFHRSSGFSTAYVGSSNLTHSAQVTGLEWNVRASAARNPDLVAKFAAVFNGYWEGGDFVPYEPGQFEAEQERAGRRDTGPRVILSPIELHPFPFQERLLELIELSRRRGHHRNLLVAATGTGKTVMAAVDYARLRRDLPRARLLFIAHREEILDQSLATFRHALRDPSFGEKWVGGSRPGRYAHVFASIQSLSRSSLDSLAPDHFDVVMVDEFHHAAAASYHRVLDHLEPVELLGLTATPERSDGLPILRWFEGRIAAEMRLWDAIDQQHLVPFVYYGIHDGLDLQGVPWRRGRGYEVEALSAVYTSDDAWARLVVQEVNRHAEAASMRCLGFCVSIAHARFMARHFMHHGIAAVAVWGDSPPAEREAALRDLANGRMSAVFSVDLFNEGVDVPPVDTILMLRPTESPTLFLQQLGRGLRKTPGKAFCTVLDFVGTHRREFRFDRRLRALLGGSRRDVERAVRLGFPFLPAGCHMQLDEKAAEIVLRSLRDAIPTRWPAKVDELRSLRRDGADPDLAGFLNEAGLELDDVYDGRKSWSDLREEAGAPVQPAGPHEHTLRRAIGRLLHIDDEERITTFRRLLGASSAPGVAALPERDRRLLRMLVASIADQALVRSSTLQEGADLLWAHPQVCAELLDLLAVLDEAVDHVHTPLPGHPDAPLQLHARYSRLEILAAVGVGTGAKIAAWQSGVFEAKEANAELLAFTLDKSTGGFSPKTRYRDYAISRTLIHWESQSITRADGPTGLRYRHHERHGRSILLFARLRTDDRAFWFLGPATYRGHVGERPMAINWELSAPLPGDLYAAFAAAIA